MRPGKACLRDALSCLHLSSTAEELFGTALHCTATVLQGFAACVYACVMFVVCLSLSQCDRFFKNRCPSAGCGAPCQHFLATDRTSVDGCHSLAMHWQPANNLRLYQSNSGSSASRLSDAICCIVLLQCVFPAILYTLSALTTWVLC